MNLTSAHTTHLRGASRHVKEMPWEIYLSFQPCVIPWEEGSTAQIHAVIPAVRGNHPQQCHNSQLRPAKPLQELFWSLGTAGAVSRPAAPEFWAGLSVFGFPHLTLLGSPVWGSGGCSQDVQQIQQQQQWGCANLHPHEVPEKLSVPFTPWKSHLQFQLHGKPSLCSPCCKPSPEHQFVFIRGKINFWDETFLKILIRLARKLKWDYEFYFPDTQISETLKGIKRCTTRQRNCVFKDVLLKSEIQSTIQGPWFLLSKSRPWNDTTTGQGGGVFCNSHTE